MSNNLRFKTSKFIDETYRVSFKFNNKTYFGFKGDTLSSALLANGIHLVGRSFKYHRPRGIMTAGSEEPNAIVQLHDNSSRTEPNVELQRLKFMKVWMLQVKIVGLVLILMLVGLIICYPLFCLQVFIIKLLCGLQVSGKSMNTLLENLQV